MYKRYKHIIRGDSVFDQEKLSHLKSIKDSWEKEKVKKTIEKRPERKERFTTGSDEEVNRLYTPLDVPDLDYSKDLGVH